MDAQLFSFDAEMIADGPHRRNAFGIGHVDHQAVGQHAAKHRQLKFAVCDRLVVDLHLEYAIVVLHH